MQFDLTPDQKLFRSTTVDFLEKEVPLTKVRELSAADAGFDRLWWKRGAELGWTSMLATAQYGGDSISGDGLLDLAIVAEEMGRRVSPGPLAVTNAMISTLCRATNSADHGAVIEAAMAGESVLAWAVQEPRRPWEPHSPGLTATRDGDAFVLSGVKNLVESGDQADHLVVTAATTDGPAQFLVPTTAPGLTISVPRSLDLIRRYAIVWFTGVSVPLTALLQPPDSARTEIDRQLAIIGCLQMAESVGAAGRALEFTIQWAFDRYSFGRPLASYQALKHRFADMHTWLEAASAITDGAAVALCQGRDDADELVSSAKAYVGQRSTDIVQDCVQMHGGIGVTWEHDVHLYLRRVTANRATYGSTNDHLRRIADLLKI